MMSHAAQIQALLAREREDYARWGRLARTAGGAGSGHGISGGSGARVTAPHPAAQARTARRGSEGPSATA